MRARGINLVLDVGANTGQYANWLREGGYTGDIISFEPIPTAFEELKRSHSPDPRWRGVEAAVGAEAGRAVLSVAESPVLSSLLDVGPILESKIPAARTLQRIEVSLISLDDVWEDLIRPGKNVFLKIDTQGYEHPVLDGIAEHLEAVSLVEVEMSLVSLYNGGSSIHDTLPRLRSAGFQVISIESGYVDADTGQVMDVDVLAGRPV